MHHSRLLCAALLLTTAIAAPAQQSTAMTMTDVNAIYKTSSRAWVSVHDPSVVHASGKTFYIIGSHRGWARSTDNMVSWQGQSNSNLFGRLNASGSAVVCNFADAFSANATTTVRALVGGAVEDVAFGPFDAKAWAHGDQADWDISGNMWAPDIIYNPNSGKWMMYMSLNGDSWHSVIVLLTADRVTGPYVYQGPVHYSGFRNTTTPEISWKKTDLELVIGTQSTLPARYNKGNDWGTWWTNDIDPCVFFDEDGELWMAYGSWSGGIFLLKLDRQTGLRDYTTTYALKNDNNGRALTDPYFGRRIAGGYYSSGEGPYVQHIGQYYYLFISYGGFAPDGGYEMRTFRSATPDGTYVDATNHDACYNGRYWLNFGPNAQTNGGMKLMAAYNGWGFQTVGECAQGHNSATADEAGRNFVVYHTKFNDGTIGHQVRTRQLFLNREGWLCAAPFQFDGETVNDDSIAAGCHFTKEQIPGTYDLLIHRYKLDHENMEEVTPVNVTLGDDGRVSGDLTGTWALTDGTAYITLKLGGVTYSGVVVPQTVDGTTLRAVGITATATSGVALWAFKLLPQDAVAYAVKSYTIPVKNNQTVNRSIPLAAFTPRFGATVSWTSSHPDIITDQGEYIPADEDTRVTLTCRIASGSYYYEQAFSVNAQHNIVPAGDMRSAIVAYYDCDAKPMRNAYDASQAAAFSRTGSGTVPTIEAAPARFGNVLRQYAGAASAASYTRFANPLQNLDIDGFTVSAWMLRDDADDLEGTLWSFTDKQGNLATVKQRFFLTGNAYFGFETPTDNFDANLPAYTADGKPKAPTGYIPAAEWALVTVTVSAADGVSLYVNGSRKAHKTFTSSAGTAANATAAARLFDYQKLITAVTEAPYFQLGIGGKAGSAGARFDDVLIYSRALDATDIRALYTMSGRRTDYGPNGADAVGTIYAETTPDGTAPASSTAATRIYDLAGRQLTTGNHGHRPTLPAGIYIRNGRKHVVR